MGMVLACSQGMVYVTGAFPALDDTTAIALLASCPQHLSLKGPHHGDRA